jgi:hypothetical protein
LRGIGDWHPRLKIDAHHQPDEEQRQHREQGEAEDDHAEEEGRENDAHRMSPGETGGKFQAARISARNGGFRAA